MKCGGDPSAERRSLERRADAPFVQAVSRLVHRREERDDVVLRVATRQADVAETERDLERVNRRVEPELIPRDAECFGELTREPLLRGDRIRAAHERVLVVRRVFSHERSELGRQHREDFADLRRAHPRLVVLEQHVVRVVVRCEALDVLSTEIDDALEPGSERREVRFLARFDPHLVRLCGDLRELHRERGRDATLTAPIAVRDADE